MTRILILNAFKNAHLTDMSANIKTVRTTEKAEATRTRILDAALDLFRSQGFDQTIMREIAAEAGVALGSAYYYFESKDALVMAFYTRVGKEIKLERDQTCWHSIVAATSEEGGRTGAGCQRRRIRCVTCG